MSFTVVQPSVVRLNRSELAVPGSSQKFIDKAPSSAADVIFFDLEDSVAADKKDVARKNVVQALNDLDFGDKTLSCRINGLDTPYMYRDIVDLVEGAGDKLHRIMIPKVGTPADIYAVDMLLTQIETAKGFKNRIGISLLVETALGIQNLHEIAAASPRNESILFGAGDYAASTGMQSTHIGGVNTDYAVLGGGIDDENREAHFNDMWHYVLSRIVVAARANGLQPVDGPFAFFKDSEGYKAAAKRAAVLGFEGKMVIHPSQIEVANELFSPSDKAIEQAKKVIAAMEEAEREGRGAVTLDGRMIDIASIRQAEVVVKKADMIAKKG